MAAGLLGIAGVLVGGALSLLTALLLERTRVRNEEAGRWREQRLQACTSYAEAIKQVARQARSAKSKDLGPTAKAEALRLLSEAETDRSLRFERVVLVCPPPVIEAAAKLNEAQWQLERLAQSKIPPEDSEWDVRSGEWVDRLANFYSEVRTDLRIEGELSERTRSQYGWDALRIGQ